MHRRELSRTEEPFLRKYYSSSGSAEFPESMEGKAWGFTESYWGRIVSGNRNDDFLAAVIFGRFAKTKRG